MNAIQVHYLCTFHGYEPKDFNNCEPCPALFRKARHHASAELARAEQLARAQNRHKLAPHEARERLSPRQRNKLARFKNARVCVGANDKPIVVLDEHALSFQ